MEWLDHFQKLCKNINATKEWLDGSKYGQLDNYHPCGQMVQILRIKSGWNDK